MSADFRALCADLLWALENAIRVIYHEDGTKHISTANPIVNRARAARRPKPPSLAEEALEACERSAFGIPGDRDTIRRALERLQELESNG